MQSYAVFAENDISEWDDHAGLRYHFPRRYRALLEPGTRVIYYKGTLKDGAFRPLRLSDRPHYFASAVIGRISPDPNSAKDDLFAEIIDYRRFSRPVLSKANGTYLEQIPESKSTNYWRYRVRQIPEETYLSILARAQAPMDDDVHEGTDDLNDSQQGTDLPPV